MAIDARGCSLHYAGSFEWSSFWASMIRDTLYLWSHGRVLDSLLRACTVWAKQAF